MLTVIYSRLCKPKLRHVSNHLKKPVFFLLIFSFITSGVFANFLAGNIFWKANEKDLLEWKLDAVVDNVEFYHAITKCHDKNVVFLKFVNKNNNKVKVSWNETFKTQITTEKNPLRGKQQLTLLPGETFTQDCLGGACKECLIMPEQVSPAYAVQIQEFFYRDISVTKNL